MMQPLTGSFVALITPMFPDGTIDYDSLKSLIDWWAVQGEALDFAVTFGLKGDQLEASTSDPAPPKRRSVRPRGTGRCRQRWLVGVVGGDPPVGLAPRPWLLLV